MIISYQRIIHHDHIEIPMDINKRYRLQEIAIHAIIHRNVYDITEISGWHNKNAPYV